MERLGLGQVSDTSQIERWIDEVDREPTRPRSDSTRSGKVQIMGFLVGQVMKRSGGRAEPKARAAAPPAGAGERADVRERAPPYIALALIQFFQVSKRYPGGRPP